MSDVKFTDDKKHEFLENGIFVLENVLSPTMVREVRDEVMRLAKWEEEAGVGHFYDERRCSQRVWNLLNKGEIFRRIIQTSVILEAMEWIFDRDTPHQKYYLSSLQGHILHPGTVPMKLHIDTPYPEPLPDWPTKANTLWVLDDFSDEIGATQYLPGSHKWKHKPKAEDQSRTDLLSAKASAGSVLIFHGALWHRGGGNSSAAPRPVVLGSFAASYAREIANEENYSVVLDPRVTETASDDLRRILGLEHGIRPGALHPAPAA